MKICSKCHTEKEEPEFQVRRASKDGLTAACKECLREYDRSRADLPHRVLARSKYAKTEEGKEARIKARKAWVERNQLKRAVHIITGNAIRDGKLIKQPCEKCGEMKVEAHHPDYSKPLEVHWLCRKCHAEHHKMDKF